MDASNEQSEEKQTKVRDGADRYEAVFSQYPGQIGVIVPNPSLGETNFGGVDPNMPYGPVYANPSFPFQQGANQGHSGGQWQQQWNGHQGDNLGGNWRDGDPRSQQNQ